MILVAERILSSFEHPKEYRKFINVSLHGCSNASFIVFFKKYFLANISEPFVKEV